MTTPRFIKKAVFDFCTEKECTISGDRHLLISEDLIELKKDKAVAISYTWGEFSRHDVLIGHLRDGSHLTMSLGEEWNPKDFIERLQSICLESPGCWIDQICIPQSDEEIRATLAAIPEIYKTLDVVVLLPSAPCKCFNDLADLAHRDTEFLESARSNRTEEEHRMIDRQKSEEWRFKQARCLNSFPCSSWFGRLWTRQELQYASSVRVMYSTNKPSPCLPIDTDNPQKSSLHHDDHDVHLLQPYLALTYRTKLQKTADRAVAFRAIGYQMLMILVPGMQAIGDYARSKGQVSAISDLCRFLSGTRLEMGQPSNTEDTEQAKVFAFMDNLSRLGANRRAATQERDYVVAVWVDCPRYALPADYKNMSLPALLNDAINQLETNFGASFISNAPAGLFGEISNGSGLWSPLEHIHPGSIEHSGTPYGVFSTNRVFNTHNKGFFLKRFIEATISLSQVAKPFRQTFQGMSSAAVFDVMANIVIKWRSDSALGLNLKQTMASDRQSVDVISVDLGYDFRQGLIDCMDSSDAQKKWSKQDVDHYSIVYRLVTDALGLDYDACRKAELVLMISAEASCLGLLRTASLEKVQGNVTIAMTVTPQGCLAYEAEPVPPTAETESSIPKYRVCGIWVPTRALGLLNISYYRDPSARDGFVT